MRQYISLTKFLLILSTLLYVILYGAAAVQAINGDAYPAANIDGTAAFDEDCTPCALAAANAGTGETGALISFFDDADFADDVDISDDADFADGVGFSDVTPSDWHYQYISELANKGLAYGNPDGTYAPEGRLLIDEFLAFTLRTLGYNIANARGYWAQGYIDKAIALGLVDSGEYDKYDVPITREQIADIVVRASGESFSIYRSYNDIFTDINTATKPDSILKAIEIGVLAGYKDHTFRPLNTATRAEAAVTVLRMIDKSYRVEVYSGIFFNPKTDLNENGVMKKEKAEEFVMYMITDNLHIDVSDDGCAIISGEFPELPEGQKYFFDFMIFDNMGKSLAYHSTVALHSNRAINSSGSFYIETTAKKEMIDCIEMMYGVIIYDPIYLQHKSEATYSTIIFYSEAYYKKNAFYRFYDGTGRVTDYDYELTRGIWGW